MFCQVFPGQWDCLLCCGAGAQSRGLGCVGRPLASWFVQRQASCLLFLHPSYPTYQLGVNPAGSWWGLNKFYYKGLEWGSVPRCYSVQVHCCLVM